MRKNLSGLCLCLLGALCVGAAGGASARPEDLSLHLSFDVDTGNAIHVAWHGEAAPFLTLANETGGPRRLSGRFRLTDLFGHLIDVPFDTEFASGATNRFPVPWPLPAKGYWLAAAEVEGTNGFSAQLKTTFAVLDYREATPPLPPGKFRMGVNYHYTRMSRRDEDATLDALVVCGAKLARGDYAAWAQVQPREDSPPDWASTDRLVADFESRGIAIDAICWGTPQWAARPDRRQSANWFDWHFTMPERQDLLYAFFRDLSARYGTRIAWYEIGNEWDLGSFRADADEAIAAQRLAYTALKAGCPDVSVLPNGWASWDSKNVQIAKAKKGFPEKVMREAHGFYDAHPVHLHGTFADYRRAILTRFLPRRHGMGIDDVPWYSNETAISGVQGGEVNAAEHVWKKILFAWAYGSRDFIWYNLRATGDDENDPEAGYGMMTRDLHPRPSYCAFAALTELLSGFDFYRILASDGKCEAYAFRGEREGTPQIVLAGWDSTSATGRCVRVKTDARRAWAVDFMGNRMVAECRGAGGPPPLNAFVFPLSRRPSALLLEGASFAEADGIVDFAASDSRTIRVGIGPFASRPPDIAIDTVADVHCFYDGNPLTVHRTWRGPADASFKTWFGVSGDALEMRVAATDDIHDQSAPEARRMSDGDCLRATLEISQQSPRWELGFRRTDDGENEAVVWEGPSDSISGLRFSSSRKGSETTYDISIPLPAITEGAGVPPAIAIALKLDDSDGEGRDLWIGMEEPLPLEFHPVTREGQSQ